jgi:hypothetical protein
VIDNKCRCGLQRCICSHRKRRPPRFLSFKIGDRVVLCPHKTAQLSRGRTGTIDGFLNHLEAMVVLDDCVSPFKQTKKCEVSLVIKTYMLRHTSECHSCCNRLTHMSGGYCPNDHKDIVFYEEQDTSSETTL